MHHNHNIPYPTSNETTDTKLGEYFEILDDKLDTEQELSQLAIWDVKESSPQDDIVQNILATRLFQAKTKLEAFGDLAAQNEL